MSPSFYTHELCAVSHSTHTSRLQVASNCRYRRQVAILRTLTSGLVVGTMAVPGLVAQFLLTLLLQERQKDSAAHEELRGPSRSLFLALSQG